MTLPKIVAKSILVFILFTLFLALTPFSYAQQPITNNKPAASKTNQDQLYKLVPVSQENQGTSAAAIAAPQDRNGQVLNIFDDVFDPIGDLINSIKNLANEFLDCVTHPASCALTGLKGIFEFGMLTFEKFVLNQILGEAGDCVLIDKNDAAAVAEAPQCADILAVMQGKQANLQPQQFGLLGLSAQATTTALAMPLPFDSQTYLASINPFKNAYATPGEDELRGTPVVLDIWTRVRDVSLALLVVATVIIGFMIMLRVPLGPRTAVTVQNSLPKIAVALLLIVFSFLISGLMVDAIRTANNLLQSMLPPITLGGAVTGAAYILSAVLVFVLALFTIVSVLFTPIAGFIVALLAILLLVLMLLVVFLMLTFKLVTRLVIFLLLVMFAPLFFLAGAFPQGGGAITFWFKRAAAALLSIPATAFMISLAMLIGSSGLGSFNLDFAASGTSGVPLLGGASGTIIDMFSWAFAAPVIGLVLLTMSIKTPEIVDELFGVKGMGLRASGFGAVLGAPGKAFKGVGDVGRSVQGIQGAASGLKGLMGGAAVSKGWGATPTPTKIAGGTPVTDPKWRQALGKVGALNQGKIQGGIDLSKATPDWQDLALKHDMYEQTPSGDIVTKEGTVYETREGEIQQPTPKKPGIEGAAARLTARAGFKRSGQKPPIQKPSFRATEQIAEDAARAKAERAQDVKDASLGGGEAPTPDD